MESLFDGNMRNYFNQAAQCKYPSKLDSIASRMNRNSRAPQLSTLKPSRMHTGSITFLPNVTYRKILSPFPFPTLPQPVPKSCHFSQSEVLRASK